MMNMSVFYTKNGIHLGTAFENIPHNLYPIVGFWSTGAIVHANFGEILDVTLLLHCCLLCLYLIGTNLHGPSLHAEPVFVQH